MNEGIQFLDIIFFALVAAFILHRLRRMLGRRTGHERPQREPFRRSQAVTDDNVIELADRSETEAEAGAEPAPQPGSAAAGLAQIKAADSRFEADQFLSGARGAYEMIIAAFAQGDTTALRPHLNDEVYDNFASAIGEREEHDRTLDSTLVAIKSADIVEASMRGRTAQIAVTFVSEIVNVVRDRSGEVLEGDPTAAREVTDIWTFARDSRSMDPNWTLIETRSAH